MASLRWGRENEDNARKAYQEEMARRGTPISTTRSGLVICQTNGCLACSPDDWVEDGNVEDTHGILEYKCPYASRDITPAEACKTKGFFCTLDENNSIRLKHNSNYYYQVQGGLAITNRKWCDFVVWTPKGLSIERINADATFWTETMLPKLLAPEHPHGRPIHELPFNPTCIVHCSNTHQIHLSVLMLTLFCGLFCTSPAHARTKISSFLY